MKFKIPHSHRMMTSLIFPWLRDPNLYKTIKMQDGYHTFNEFSLGNEVYNLLDIANGIYGSILRLKGSSIEIQHYL